MSPTSSSLSAPIVRTEGSIVDPRHTMGSNRTFEKHRLAMVHRSKAAQAAHLALFQLQDIPSSEEQVMGVAVLFATLCSRLGVDPQEMHTMAMRVLKAPDEGATDTNNALRSLRDFAGIHLAGKEESFV